MTETEQLPESVETTEQEQDFDDFGDFDDFSSAPATQEPQNIHDPPSSTSSSISKILLKLQSNSLDFSLFINIPDPITNSSNIESLIQQDQETKLLIPNQIFESSSWYPLYLQLSCEANPSTTAKYRWKKSFIRNSFLHSLDVVEEKVKSISNIAVDIPLKKSRDAEFAYAKSLVDIPESQLVLMTRVELEKICADLNDMTHKIQDQAAFYLDAKEQLLMDAELHNKMIASLVQYAQQQSQQGSPKAKKGVARRR